MNQGSRSVVLSGMDSHHGRPIIKGCEMGLSENRVPRHPMVNDHYPYEMAIIGNIPYFQTNPSGVSGNGFLGLSKYFIPGGMKLYSRYLNISPMR